MIPSQFQKELIQSGYIHAPLPLHQEKSLEAEQEKKEVLIKRTLWQNKAPCPPHYEGIGSFAEVENAGLHGAALRVTAPTEHPVHSYVDSDAPRYNSQLIFAFPGENWESFNRIALWIKPDSPGSRSVHLRLHLVNEGKEKIPDAYHREGSHLVNLINHRWNRVIWEFALLPRDFVTEFSIAMDADGWDTATGPYFQFDFDEIELQQVANPEMEKGWACAKGKISYSMSGYFADGPKTAIGNVGAKTFSVIDAQGAAVYTADIHVTEKEHGTFETLDFTPVTAPGLYRLQAGEVCTEPFEIGHHVLESAVWKVLNFFFCERCGYPVPGKHGHCHLDVIAKHKDLILPYGGGWHDAGDMSQQTVQTAEIAQQLFELAEQVTDDPLLYQRVLEEALWGIEHTLRTRFGDGYRATSVGLGQWTDNKIGNTDDVAVRVHNHAYQNFICAAIEACAARALRNYDPDLSWGCMKAAKEDYAFACARFAEKGMEIPIMWEHTMNSGLSQYYAAAAWAAAVIYQVTGDEAFIPEAEGWGEKLLACQDRGEAGIPLTGFFYRDDSKKSIVHYTHQSREHSFAQALEALCTALPQSPRHSKWEEALGSYGAYLKGLYGACAPYGMLPAGVYSMTETEDRETFPLLHLLVDFEKEKENYKEQLETGISLGKGYYIRRFPVWFSFRGNSAILLSQGKGASIAGRYFGDKELIDIAREQLYWMSGKNPFCQSLIYGEGHRYCQQDANYPGEMVGEMPVGVETLENEDIPYWPAGNNATYKEVWMTPAGRWISIVADLAALGR